MSKFLFSAIPLLILIAAWIIGYGVLTIAQTPRSEIAWHAATAN